jgi:maltose 6'-phosphate phosphatase
MERLGMKLLTLNSHSWQEDNPYEKIKHLVETIIEKSYDVIALQEVSQTVEEIIVYENIKIDNYGLVLLNELKKHGVDSYSLLWEFSHNYSYQGDFEEGLAILTKYPVVDEHSFYVSTIKDVNNWKTRKIIGATIEYNEKQFTFYSCHMGWWHDDEEPFKDQVKVLLQKINKESTVFLMGDFNNDAFIEGEGYEYLINHGLFDTYHLAELKDDGVTVMGKIPGWEENEQKKRIDLILTNRLVPVKYSKVIFNNKNKAIVSDHFGVEVEIIDN